MTSREDCNQTGAPSILDRYVLAAMKYGDATEQGNSDEANTAYFELERLFAEIERNGDREKLVPLLIHASPSVRAEAAFHTYVLDTNRSESVLEEVASGPGLVGFSAGMTLKQLRNGELTPK